MKEIVKVVATALITSVLVIVGVNLLVGDNQSTKEVLGGGTRFPNGISADTTSPTAGQVRGTTFTSTGAVTVGTGGTAVDLVACSAATEWNPGSVGSTTVQSLDVTVTGFSMGDIAVASISSTTSGLGLLATASTTNLVRVTLFQPDFDAAAVDLASTTVRVCAISN